MHTHKTITMITIINIHACFLYPCSQQHYEWINKMYIRTMEYRSVLKRKEIMIHATT